MLVLNLGSRFLVMELSENQEQMLSNKIIRRFIIFTVVFVSTRDILVSFIVTAIFIVLVSGLFNENSKYCVMTKPVLNNVTEDEYKEAIKVKLYEKQKNKNKILNVNMHSVDIVVGLQYGHEKKDKYIKYLLENNYYDLYIKYNILKILL